MQFVAIAFELLGALALFMYGMQLSSDGIQRAAGERLRGAVNLMTKNRFLGTLTGIIVTILIQSSSATTVMVVSFVNAGLLSLVQSIGVIMGANIGTTLTGWIIAAVGIQKYSVVAMAIPIFGVGFFMSIWKKWGDSFRSYGEALMGFALIFLGLDFMAKAIPDPSGDALLFLQNFADKGWLAVALSVLVGIVFTMLINASSATIAITIGLAAKGIIDFPIAAAITLGANIGTTFDSFLVSLGGNINAKRAAWAHIIFNIFGTVWVLVVFYPFIRLVDFVVPGPITPLSIGAHIAMLHTLFNAANTVILMPFTRQYAALVSRLIRPRGGQAEAEPSRYVPQAVLPTPELNLIYAASEVQKLAALAKAMFERFTVNLGAAPKDGAAELEWFAGRQEYSDQMREELSRYLLEVTRLDVTEKTEDSIGRLLRVLNDLNGVSGYCANLARVLEKTRKRRLELDKKELEGLEPYTRLVDGFLSFLAEKSAPGLTGGDLERAREYERLIDESRSALKRLARKRLQAGAEVRGEMAFLDMVRAIERIGDCAYSSCRALSGA